MRLFCTIPLAATLLAAAALPAIAAPAVRIIPEPQQIEWKSGTGFRVNAKTRIVVNADPDDKDLFIAEQLRKKIWDTTGHLPAIVPGKPGAPAVNVIAIGTSKKNAAIASALKSWPEAAKSEPRSEGYILGVKRESIMIDGFDQKGVFYGCQTLIQLLEQYGKKPIDSLFCYDYPDLPIRGILVGTIGDFDLDFAREMISEIIARQKLNWVEVYVGASSVWDTHPELYHVPNPAPKAKLVALADIAREHFMEFVPACADWVWGDFWLAATPENRDIVENPGSDGFDICTRSPRARKLIREVRDEIIDTFRPNYLLMSGLSEAITVVSPDCPRCKDKSVIETYSEIIEHDAAYFASKGVRPIMWSDMVRDDMPAGSSFETHKCVPTLPKNVIIQDWDYGTRTRFPSLDTWKENGLESIGSPYGFGSHGYVGKENIYNWATSAKEAGIMGMVAFNKVNWTYKEALLNNTVRMIDLACFPFVAEWSWSVGKPNWDPAPYDGLEQVKSMIAPDRPRGLEATPGAFGVVLKWTNPPSAEMTGTWICCRTDRYPTSPTDGMFVCDKPGKASTGQAFIDRTPRKGKVYYSAFSHDDVRRFSASAEAVVELPD